VDIFDALKQVGRPLEHSRADGRKGEVPSDEKDRVMESDGIVHVVVVQDDSRTEDNPYRDDSSSRDFSALWFGGGCSGGRKRQGGSSRIYISGIEGNRRLVVFLDLKLDELILFDEGGVPILLVLCHRL